jgi:hypothetical protein
MTEGKFDEPDRQAQDATGDLTDEEGSPSEEQEGGSATIVAPTPDNARSDTS